MNIDAFSEVSVIGKTAYGILCFEEYIKIKYPDTDMIPVLELMWVMTCNPIDTAPHKFVEIVPECLFEFDSYNNEFEEISEEEFYMFRKILNRSDRDLNELMISIYNIITIYECTRITDHGLNASHRLEDAIKVLEKNNIPLPDIQKVISYTSDKCDGWGEYIDPKGISTMLYPDN